MEKMNKKAASGAARERPAAVSADASVRSELAVGKRVGSTVNTMKVLSYVAGKPAGASATEIAKATGINLSTCFNIARTLEADGYLHWLAESKRYAVGPGLTQLAHQLTTKARNLSQLQPAMQRIANAYELTVTLWHRCSMHSMELLMVAAGESAVRIEMPVGQRLPVLLGGMGRIMALQGGLTEQQLTEIFNGVHWGRALSFKTFLAQARQARRLGYGVDEGYTHRSVTAVAVPVPSAGGVVTEACSATMFLNQHGSERMAALVAELQGLALEAAAVTTRQ